MLPTEAVQEFIELYKKNYGISLDPTKGAELANRLYRFLKLITKPSKSEVAKSNWWFLLGPTLNKSH